MGIPATGRKIDIAVLDLFAIRGGVMIEHWALLDNLGMLRELGATTILECLSAVFLLARTGHTCNPAEHGRLSNHPYQCLVRPAAGCALAGVAKGRAGWG